MGEPVGRGPSHSGGPGPAGARHRSDRRRGAVGPARSRVRQGGFRLPGKPAREAGSGDGPAPGHRPEHRPGVARNHRGGKVRQRHRGRGRCRAPGRWRTDPAPEPGPAQRRAGSACARAGGRTPPPSRGSRPRTPHPSRRACLRRAERNRSRRRTRGLRSERIYSASGFACQKSMSRRGSPGRGRSPVVVPPSWAVSGLRPATGLACGSGSRRRS